jgi:membrane associated rhomboid family serine protease
MFKSCPVVKNLLYINIALFVVQLILKYSGISLVGLLALFPTYSNYFGIHQLITHQFLHAGWIHLIFNMFALATIAPAVEEKVGSKKFLLFYLLCGVGSAILHLSLITSNNPMVGASGAVYGILLYFMFLRPDEKLYLFFIPIGIRAKYLIPVLLTIELYLATNSLNDGIGHWAHIGGAITGTTLYLLNRQKK